MDKSKGWVAIYRSLMDHWLFSDKPFCFTAAFLDLVMLANYKDKKTVSRGELVDCERGCVNLSMKILAERWGWGRNKVRTFLDKLESDGMVELDITPRRTVIKITNYDVYQSKAAMVLTPTGASDRAADDAANATAIVHVGGITKKEKKEYILTKNTNPAVAYSSKQGNSNVRSLDQNYADLDEEEYV